MSSNARVLAFPVRPQPEVTLTATDVNRVVSAYVDDPFSVDQCALRNPDVMAGACGHLRDRTDSDPTFVAAQAAVLFELLTQTFQSFGVFDEREYFAGELCILVARASRLMGQRVDTEKWLDRADSYYRKTVNSAPHLLNVTYVRLALRYDQRQFEPILEQAPDLAKSFDTSGMVVESAKAVFLLAATLKHIERGSEAHDLLLGLLGSDELQSQRGLVGQIWIEIGEYNATIGDFGKAIESYKQALSILRTADRPIALVNLKMSLGEALNNQGLLSQALDSFQSAVEEADALEMAGLAAYARLLAAETLIGLGRVREAEWTIRTALPTINEQAMVAEGVAALGFLQQLMLTRATDAGAVRDVRKHIQL